MSNIPIEVNTGETKTITFHTAGTFNTEDIVFSISATGGDANTTMSGVAYCSTAAATASKTATMPGFELATGQRILLQTTNTNSATSNVTLSVNGTTAKPIKIGTANPTASNFPASWWIAYYDGTNWVLTRIYLSDTNTDTKVTQTYYAESDYTYWRPLVVGYSSGSAEGFTPSTATNTTVTFKTITCQPSTGTIRAGAFKKIGGTSSQFLKADGSVDTNTYSLSSHDHDTSYSPLDHVHAFSELSSTPTTISGYGITDAKIDGQSVVLGSNTITIPTKTSDITNDSGFLTSSSSLDATKLTGAVPTSSYTNTDYVYICSTGASTAAKTATSKTTNTPVSKRFYYVYISTANTKNTALTFNPNSSGAKPIYINGTASGASNYTLPAGLYYVYYDGTNWYFNTDGMISCSGIRIPGSSGFLKADGTVDTNAYSTSDTKASSVVVGPTSSTSVNTDSTGSCFINVVNSDNTVAPGVKIAGSGSVSVNCTNTGTITISGTSGSTITIPSDNITLSTTAKTYITSGSTARTIALPSTDPYTSARTPSSHTHGNIQNGGTLQTTDVAIANGDKLVVTDSSNSSKIARTSVVFDGSTKTQFLSKKGTWETPSMAIVNNTLGTVLPLDSVAGINSMTSFDFVMSETQQEIIRPADKESIVCLLPIAMDSFGHLFLPISESFYSFLVDLGDYSSENE